MQIRKKKIQGTFTDSQASCWNLEVPSAPRAELHFPGKERSRTVYPSNEGKSGRGLQMPAVCLPAESTLGLKALRRGSSRKHLVGGGYSHSWDNHTPADVPELSGIGQGRFPSPSLLSWPKDKRRRRGPRTQWALRPAARKGH